jgi:hypothetical protein
VYHTKEGRKKKPNYNIFVFLKFFKNKMHAKKKCTKGKEITNKKNRKTNML